MCWNKEVSFLTFGLGTVLNLLCGAFFLRRGLYVPAVLLIGWQYGLLMQLPEGAAWIDIEAGKVPTTPSRVAMILNVTQPIAMFVSVTLANLYGSGGGIRQRNWFVAPIRSRGMIALSMYLLLLIGDSDELWQSSDDITPEENCSTLDLRWWNSSRTILYVVGSVIVLSDIDDFVWRVTNVAIFVASLLIAFHNFPCGLGSLWCWIISMSALVFLVVQYLREITSW